MVSTSYLLTLWQLLWLQYWNINGAILTFLCRAYFIVSCLQSQTFFTFIQFLVAVPDLHSFSFISYWILGCSARPPLIHLYNLLNSWLQCKTPTYLFLSSFSRLEVWHYNQVMVQLKVATFTKMGDIYKE